MTWAKRIFDFYLDASFHVAFAVVALYCATIGDLQVNHNQQLAAFLFFATMVCYNFMKYGIEAEKYLIVGKGYHKIIQGISFFALGLAIYFMVYLDPYLWGVIGLLTLVAALYAIPFLPGCNNLRHWGGIKIFLVAFVWTGMTAVLPILDNGLPWHWMVVYSCCERFLLVLMLMLPFEIRDMDDDVLALPTIPQRWGIKFTKRVGYLLVAFILIGHILAHGIDRVDFVSKIILVCMLIFAIYFSTRRQSSYFASFWVEAIPIFWWGIWALLQLGHAISE